MIEIKDLLPIGSVVIMKDGEQPLMIYGVKQSEKGSLFKKMQEYDYICVPYPHGLMGPNSSYYINHNDIDKILFKGYESEDRKKFLNELEQIYSKKNM